MIKMVWTPSEDEASLEDVKSCVGIGWHKLLENLISDLEQLGWDGRIDQVKQKLGGLRFYVSDANIKIGNRISEAMEEADSTCEMCGEPGRTNSWGHFWIMTLCPECGKKREITL